MINSLFPRQRGWSFHAPGLGKTCHFALAIILTCVFVMPGSALAADFSKWDQLLKQTVAPKTLAGVQLTAVN